MYGSECLCLDADMRLDSDSEGDEDELARDSEGASDAGGSDVEAEEFRASANADINGPNGTWADEAKLRWWHAFCKNSWGALCALRTLYYIYKQN